jgi:large subunit ribosomal protein L4
MKVNIIDLENKVHGQVSLNESIFSIMPRADILHRVVEWQRAKKRSGTHKTKGISDISGTTKKPYKQKGTGRARQGSLRSAQFRGGAVIFGPVVRSHEYSLPKKVRKLGLKMALASKLAENNLVIIKNIDLDNSKTSSLYSKLKQLDMLSALVVDAQEVNNNFKLASANIVGVDVLPVIGLNVYDILKKQKLILTEDAIASLEKRLSC